MFNGIVSYRCHFVAIWHSLGLHKHEKWRFSFSQTKINVSISCTAVSFWFMDYLNSQKILLCSGQINMLYLLFVQKVSLSVSLFALNSYLYGFMRVSAPYFLFHKTPCFYLRPMAMHKTAYLYSYLTCTIKVWHVCYRVSQLDPSSLMSIIILDVWFSQMKV